MEDNDNYEVSFVVDGSTVDEGIGTVNVEVRLSGIPFPISAGIGDIEIPIMVEGRTLSGADCTYEEFVTFPTSQDPSMKGAAELISSFVVTIVNDNEVEDDEYADFTFGELPPRVIRSTTDHVDTHTLTVEDNDGTIYTVSFDTASQAVAEDAGTVQVQVSISPTPAATAAPITIPIVVDASSTATLVADYALPSPSSVTFNEGDGSMVFVVTIVADPSSESTESVSFTFGDLPADVVVSTDTGYSAHRLEITDNDTPAPPPPPESYVVSFDIASQTVVEGVGTVQVAVSISPMLAAADAPITVPILVSDVSTAILADDYALPSPSSVTFNEGDGSMVFVVTIVADTGAESTEYVEFLFGNLPPNVHVPSGISARHVLRLADDDGPPAPPPGPSDPINYDIFFTPASLTVDEGVGIVQVQVSISPMPDPADAPITIPIVVDGSVTNVASTSDYVLPTSSVTFDTTMTEALFTVMITDDDLFEMNETIVLGFGSLLPTLHARAPDKSIITITDNEVSTPLPFLYDTDNDGLIEVTTVEQLNVIRYDLDGDGNIDSTDAVNFYRGGGGHADNYVSAFGYAACPIEGYAYKGYELAADLDFKKGSESTDEYSIWAEASTARGNVPDGWTSIGSSEHSSTVGVFIGTFDGNGHTISNLYINRFARDTTNHIGLFGNVGSGGIICSVGLEDVYVSGSQFIGALAATSSGTITSSYVTGTVHGAGSNVGGLVGFNQRGTILASYVTGTVTGDFSVGGLVGTSDNGTIQSSYSTGDVTANSDVGGLVGSHTGNGELTLSYATGDVSGNDYVGGLVGAFDNRPTNSYYYAGASVMKNGAPVDPDPAFARSASFLSALSASSAGWDELVDVDGDPATTHDQYMPWDFRDANYEYPVLRPAPRGATPATWEDFGTQFHAPIVCFDAERDMVEEPSSTPIVRQMGVTMYNAPTDGAISVRVLEHVDSTATNSVDCDFPLAGVQLDFGRGTFTNSVSVTVNPDDMSEEDEEIIFALVDLSPGVILGAPSLTTVTILAHGRRVFFPPPTSRTVGEAHGSVDVLVFIDPPPTADSGPITVEIMPLSVSEAVSGADYTYVNSVIFDVGESSSSFVVTIIDDTDAESAETVSFGFHNLGDLLGSGETTVLTVTDNDTEYTVSFSDPSSIVAEDVDTVSVEVFIDPARDAELIIPIVVNGGTLSGTEYDYDTSVTFPANQTYAFFIVTITDDDEIEDSEDVTFAFDTSALPVDVVLGSPDQHVLTVEDDDDYVVSFDIASQTVVEGNIEFLDVFVSISPQVPADDSPIEIPITIVGGTLSKDDCTYEKSVQFTTGVSERSFAVTIVDDDLVEGDEYVEFTFDDLPLGVIPSETESTHTLTVEDNDNYEVSFSVDAGTVDEGIGTVDVEVRLSGIPLPISAGIGDIAIPIKYTSRTLSGADCTYEKNVTFPTSQMPVTEGAGELISSFAVTIVDDVEVEDSEDVTFAFDTSALPEVVSGDQAAYILTVEDNDYAVSFLDSPVIVGEDIGTVRVLVSIDPVPNKDIAIPIKYTSRTLSDADYTYDSMVSFSPGDSGSSFDVTIVDDIEMEGGEFVEFAFDTSSLPDVVGGSVPTFRLIVTDNDGSRSYVVSFSKDPLRVAEDADAVEVEMTISPAPNDALDIPVNVSASTLTLDADYTYDSVVHFDVGQARSSFNVTIVDDTETEGGEFVDFTFDTSTLLPDVLPGIELTSHLVVMDNDGPHSYVVSFSTNILVLLRM